METRKRAKAIVILISPAKAYCGTLHAAGKEARAGVAKPDFPRI
jgi:hypothetical protein